MGWSIGYDEKWKRDVGYGVPAICDHPDCDKEIDRGLGYVCGGAPYGGEEGCGLFFCAEHRFFSNADDGPEMCQRCCDDSEPFEPTGDTKEWNNWKLRDESWKLWRDKNLEEVEKLRAL